MSRPGYPVVMSREQTLHNSYEDYLGNVTNGTDVLITERLVEDKIGNNTPGFPNVKFVNEYIRSRFTWHLKPVTVNGQINRGGGHFDTSSGEFGGGYNVGYYPWEDPIFSTDAEIGYCLDRLTNGLIDNIQSARVNLGEVLHTRAQAASMVSSTLNRLVGVAQTLRKGNFVGAARYLTGADPRTRSRVRTSRSGRTTSGAGGIPEQWLALQYGWKPLLQDIYNSCETVHKAWNDNGDLFSVESKANIVCGDAKRTREASPPWGPRFLVTSGQRSVRGKARIYYRLDSNALSSLSQLGVTNPASLAWELLPYSFVVDWLYPVGSFLERLDYANGLRFESGWMTFHSRQDAKQRLLDTSVAGTWFGTTLSTSFSGGDGHGDAFFMKRSVISGFPSVPLPHIKNPFSPTHFANGLSLLATALRGGKTPR